MRHKKPQHSSTVDKSRKRQRMHTFSTMRFRERMTTFAFHFTPNYIGQTVKLYACIHFNNNVFLSINQKKTAQDNTTPKQVLFKL